MSVTPEDCAAVYAEADCLYPASAVEAALDRMAAAITERLARHNPLVLCVLSGAIVPLGHLLTRLHFPLQLDYLHATRYHNQTQGGTLQWIARPLTSLQGRVVLVIDDILDEGVTLAAILEHCRAEKANEVYCGVLARKDRPRLVDVQPDFIGLDIPDRYVFGYGMDYRGYWRNAPGIYAVKGL